jgi:hypothetical protein
MSGDLRERLEHPGKKIRQEFYEEYTVTGLKVAIVVWAVFVSILVIFFIDNKWILAGILAYEVLP